MEKNLGRGKKRAGVKIETKKKSMTWSFFPNICNWSTFYLELWPFIGLHLVWRMWAISQPDFKKVEKRIRVQSWRVVWSESFLSFFVFRNHEEYGKLIKSIVIFLGTKGLIIIYFSLFYPVEVCSTGKDILWNWETFHSQLETKPRLSFRRKSDICIKHLAAGS